MLKGVLQSRWFTPIAVAVIGLTTISLIKTAPLVGIAVKEGANLNQKISELKTANKETEGLAEYLNSSAYLERQARLKLNYKKPDESVFFVYQKQTVPTIETGTTQSQEGIAAKLKKWWNNLFQK
jgi:cell division protein FtsB